MWNVMIIRLVGCLVGSRVCFMTVKPCLVFLCCIIVSSYIQCKNKSSQSVQTLHTSLQYQCINVYIYPTPSPRVGYDTKSILFKQNLNS